MGNLILCGRELASIPYYIETVSLNVYSLEEICFYLIHNIELVEPEFMDEELCEWIKNELKYKALADRLTRIMQEHQSFVTFVITLMQGCDYCTRDEILDVKRALESFENKSEAECRKMRADRFLTRKRYEQCIPEYRKLLKMSDLKKEGVVFEGNLWHNLGTAYAGLFLFEEAADCYEKAYLCNQNNVSMEQAKAARILMQAEEIRSKETVGSINLAAADQLLVQWKEEYKKSCR